MKNKLSKRSFDVYVKNLVEFIFLEGKNLAKLLKRFKEAIENLLKIFIIKEIKSSYEIVKAFKIQRLCLK